ncbi:MAG: glutamate synthase large subunit [Candidatus Latescibacteria bacterium]|nr:glutamate synthase large subunit [Candidatus Latescibacterota bacterium]
MVYKPSFEQGNCGVGFIARIDGRPCHSIIEDAVRILVNLEHRGPVGYDASDGDGAGLMIRIPDEYLHRVCYDDGVMLPEAGNYAVAMVFLPGDDQKSAVCSRICEEMCEAEGAGIIRWRDVPVHSDCISARARKTQPIIRQLFISRNNIPGNAFELKLYVIRRRIENEALKQHCDMNKFFIASFSSKTIVYKGMMSGRLLPEFYLDLRKNDFTSAFAIVHQRYSTNNIPTWHLAQPMRFVAHNGALNTIGGNVNHMRIREPYLQSKLFGNDIEKIKPVIVEGGSDTSAFDNVLELLVHAGRSLPHVMMMMIPEAWGMKYFMGDDRRAFYEYHAAIMEPWDGPAVMVFGNGRYVGATLDRNGLRSARYTITNDGVVVLASEAGVLDFPGDQVRSQGRLQSGKMFLVDLEQNRVVPDNIIKATICRQKPYRHWVQDNRIELRGFLAPAKMSSENPEVLLQKHHAFGYTAEELKKIGISLLWGQEPVGSMGDDTPLAVLSDRPKLLFSYFKQLFAQVISPPIDPFREELVMSLMNFAGRKPNILQELPESCRRLKLPHPILTPDDMERLRTASHPDIAVREIDILYPAEGGGDVLRESLDNIFAQAGRRIEEGATFLILTDRHMNEKLAPVPILLVTSGLHHYLVRHKLRSLAGIVVESGEVRETMHFAILLGYGANAICPHVALSTVRELAEKNTYEKQVTPDEAMDFFITAIKKGLLKTLSRVGISTVRSYSGSQMFEAVGLSEELVDTYFHGTVTRIGGIGLEEIAAETRARHEKAYPSTGSVPVFLDVGGDFQVRSNGEKHIWMPDAIFKLQQATRRNDYDLYKEYSEIINNRGDGFFTIRSLFNFRERTPVPLDEVEPIESILKRFSSSGMSFGALSRQAHETIAIAMNRLGSRSNTGEGGEDPDRYKPDPDGSNRGSSTKQIASGRFGVTTEYLVNADELQIKIAQGAKPGEGGQLPGSKVDEKISKVRHTTPGITLISPPPHHDIYSIEDLAQLIYDLRSVNPKARISVKLVSEAGVGMAAAGVAKSNADIVLICGHDGGTGSSPLSAIKHAGVSWELGLVETHQTLIKNNLRNRIRIQIDGQLKSGRDLAVACLLGADEFAFGTVVLVALGCIMLRKCHLNTCSVGIATQDPLLSAYFTGKPEYIERLMRFLAEDLREHMARLGFRTLDEMRGHAEILDVMRISDHWKMHNLDFSRILTPVNGTENVVSFQEKQKIVQQSPFEKTLIEMARPALEKQEPVHIALPVRNTNRSVGSALSGEITRLYGSTGLPPDTIHIYLKGSPGQSLGAFCVPGVTIRVEGCVNDYLGKGMSGGKIILTPPANARFTPSENVIAGNTALYGATDGEIYVYGIAGERFAVRNSGAIAVVEGIGDHGCEYMTGGVVVVLGSTGNNFAAGMGGGIAYVYNKSEMFESRCNLDMVDLESVWQDDDVKQLRSMIETYFKLTDSTTAGRILENWESALPLFVKVMPIDYRMSLERMRLSEGTEKETLSATEEVYNG